ncbi:hypothetical protein [Bradyrhizobium liaoningense]|uniref:hypothetical protein n=1 Tax=Bradyrhizobium liaoningense TaxID=43992 RepID=UPI001BA92CE5|nr:hypothetical protein [Bradyrhizobium liaoningense]MBR0712681.1 hypothetical protein [Bradyrhizobium liaoningense]
MDERQRAALREVAAAGEGKPYVEAARRSLPSWNVSTITAALRQEGHLEAAKQITSVVFATRMEHMPWQFIGRGGR